MRSMTAGGSRLRPCAARVTMPVFMCVALCAGSHADDWLFFRGPTLNGVSTETGWSITWPKEGPRIAWRKNVGIGASSVTVAGDRMLTMGNKGDRDIVICLRPEDGEVLWEHAYACKFKKRMFEGGTAWPTGY